MTDKTKKTNQTKTSETKTTQTNSAKLSWLPKKTFELEITIPWDQAKKAYDKVLDKATKNTTIKGFRQGKAPKATVEESIGKTKIYEQTVEEVVLDAYIGAVKQNNLRPIINPQVSPVSMEENKDWVVKVKACEEPDIKLNNYKEAIKGLKAKSAIWTPDKAQTEEKDKQPTKPNLDQIFEELLKTVEIEVSDMLVDNEANRLLSTLVDQIQATGLTVAAYLESKKLTQQDLQNQYRKIAESNLKVEFILNKIGDEEKMEMPIAEAEKMIAEVKDPNVVKHYQDPHNKTYLALMIRKQKVVDFLSSL